MVAGSSPRLSIGLPVYNGERFLRFALDSILAQTFTDYELVICDNASTDETMRICQDYAARDSRIRYYRNLENIGAAANFNRAFELSRAPLFKWAAADDVISPTFIEKCVAALDADSDVILAYSRVDRIDSSGEIDGTYDYPMRVDHPSPVVRFSDLILINHFCVAVFGVMRREVLARTRLIGKYVGSDRVLLAELGLRGKLHEVPDYLFHRRDHPQTSGRMFNIYNRLSWFDPTQRQKIFLVNWNTGLEYLRLILRIPLSQPEKLACLKTLVRWIGRRRKALLEDMKLLVVQLLPFSLSLANLVRRRQNNHMKTGGDL
jgi:glycosyltransferase involved in cell wall biosynthesis